jgi:hypothetical protein
MLNSIYAEFHLSLLCIKFKRMLTGKLAGICRQLDQESFISNSL